jgi:4-amino-4-deoxy-L-arabinose transferase-like glycosyltransferase
MALTGVSETTIRAHAERLPQALPREPLRSLSDKGSAHWRDRVEWAVVFCAALLLYFLTASRTIEWLDSGQFVLRIVSNDISDPIGLCCVHPLHFWMGRLAVWMLPVAPPFAIALVSALGGAIAVANVFGIVRALTRQALPAILAAAGLAFAHTFWRMSTYVEVYTLSAALLTAEFWALVLWDETRHARWLVLMLLANGLGLANHDLALLTLPIVGFVLLNAVRTGEAGIRTLGAAVVVWFAGASPFLWLIVREASSSGWSAAMGSALFGTFKPQVLGYVMRATYTATSVAFTLLSFPNLTLPAALLGFLRAGRMGVRRLSYRVLVAATAFHLLFVLRYGVIDQYTFLVPVYSLIAVFAGIGYAAAIGLGARKTLRWLAIILVALTPAVYVGAERTARHFHVLRSWERHKPYRDDYWIPRPG